MADADFFAAPPPSDEPPMLSGDAPIMLGEAPPAEQGFAMVPPTSDGGGATDFAAPPQPDAAGADFLGGGAPDSTMDSFAVVPPSSSDEQQPAYLGDVNETAGAAAIVLPPPDADAPILLGPTGEEQPVETVEDEGPPEPSPMQKWNEQWQETLKARKDEENARKAELLEEAKVAMELFHQEREQKREAKMAKNREDEQEKLEAIEADLENDNSWQRVCKLIELSHDSTKQAQDVKRMRDTLILLKNEPTRALALGS